MLVHGKGKGTRDEKRKGLYLISRPPNKLLSAHDLSKSLTQRVKLCARK